jgi:protein O-GlcNAc transferase
MEKLDPSQQLTEALGLVDCGQLDIAEAKLRQLVAEGTRLPQSWMALGVICGERGDRAQRRFWLLQARALEQKIAPGNPSLRLLLNLQVDALERGEIDQALAYGDEALSHFPKDGEALLQQARLLALQGRSNESKSLLEQCLPVLQAQVEAEPEAVKGWRLLARAEQMVNHADLAIAACQRALSIDPNHVPTLLLIGRLLTMRGQIDGAMPWLMNALAVAPNDPYALSSTGMALKELGDHLQAVDLFRKSLAIDPTQVETCFFLGATLSDLGLYGEAEKAFRDGLAIAPADLDCRMNLASTLRNKGEAAEAVAIYRQLLAEAPDAQGAFHNLMFTYSISDEVSPAEVLETARRFWQGLASQFPAASAPLAPLQVIERPLRVGLLSADIGSHVVGRFLDPLLRFHDPNRCHLELISMHRRYEQSSEALIALADGFHSLEGVPQQEGRARLQDLAYDLIVDTSGYTRGTGIYLLCQRCAPVQAHYIGYHATTGLDTIDWFIGDAETASPEFAEQFSERLWRLPRPWLAYPSQPSFPDATPLMQTDRPVLGAFCQVPKMTSETLTFWSAALRRVPNAMLVLKDRGIQDPGVRSELERKLADQGVDPDRLVFLPPEGEWKDHVDLYNILDVALDTTPWSSATTGFEALAMGTPLVAIRGGRMAARMSSSLVKGVGHPEWTAETPEAFASVVESLCSDLEGLRRCKPDRQRQTKQSPLFDSKDLAHHVQQAFLAMGRRACEASV